MMHWLSADLSKSAQEDNKESFLHYTELGWGATVGRMKIIRMISEGRFGKDDVVVTLPDRAFMYSKFFKVVPFAGNPIQTLGLTPTNSNYLSWLQELYTESGQFVRWRWPQDVPMILDLDYEPCSPPPCVVINHRVRGFGTGRNCDEANTRNLVSMVMDLGYKPYISGKYAENVDPRAVYVPSLRTTMSLVHHENCKCYIASGGPVLLAQQCCRSKLICLNVCCKGCVDVVNTCKACNFLRHPLFVSNDANFTGCEQHIIPFLGVHEAKRIISGG